MFRNKLRMDWLVIKTDPTFDRQHNFIAFNITDICKQQTIVQEPSKLKMDWLSH